jgi:lysyl-tRNA synthetase, class II
MLRGDLTQFAIAVADILGQPRPAVPMPLHPQSGKTIYGIFEAVVEPNLIQPTIIYDYPTVVSPLSKQKPDDPDHVERFEIFAGGFELGNAFSELNDPVEQKKRFEHQLAERAAATTKRTRWTRTTCARWLTGCLRRAAKASASTGW